MGKISPIRANCLFEWKKWINISFLRTLVKGKRASVNQCILKCKNEEWGKRVKIHLSVELPKSISPNHPLSKRFRRAFEIKWIKVALGIPLTGLTLMGAMISPLPAMGEVKQYAHPLTRARDEQNTNQIINETEELDVMTEEAIHAPVKDIEISQHFSHNHPGVDLKEAWGSPVYAIEKGVVIGTNHFSWGYGNHVIIKHDNESTSLYGHLSVIEVRVGDQVIGGQEIGKVGSTGWSTGSHVHLEISDNGIRVDPDQILGI